MKTSFRFFVQPFFCIVILLSLFSQVGVGRAASTRIDLVGPKGSGKFGTVIVLPNANIIVIDSEYDAPGSISNVGAVYLYGPNGEAISALVGSTAEDRIGSGGVEVLPNGNFLIFSPKWDRAGAVDAGAVTWASAKTGVAGVLSDQNSMVGSTANDRVGEKANLHILLNGNYVIATPFWDNGSIVDAGAVTWGDGFSGSAGVISDSISLVGASSYDRVGDVYLLANGHYVVASPYWDRGSIKDAGAVTWGNKNMGTRGVVSEVNSLYGSTANDRVGYSEQLCLEDQPTDAAESGEEDEIPAYKKADPDAGPAHPELDPCDPTGLAALENGHYVLSNPNWDDPVNAVVDAGAVTWVNGWGAAYGAISSQNSLVGTHAADHVGSGGSTPVGNSNYVVSSPLWDSDSLKDVGAATWVNGSARFVGVVSSANSLVGTHINDQVSSDGIVALSNGNYLVCSSLWDYSAATDAGAVTWANGQTGLVGVVSQGNSLVGSHADDQVGSHPYDGGYVGLPNGHYVIASNAWNNLAGAVTWADGATGVQGVISQGNSLIGAHPEDHVGTNVVALSNGNYVVGSPYWSRGLLNQVGAVTWANGSAGLVGVVNVSNSLYGSSNGDRVGEGIIPLSNGNYVVKSSLWDNAGKVDAGAVTWGDGAFGMVGNITKLNSLVGNTAGDRVGRSVIQLPNGNYVIGSPLWDSPSAINVGAVTWADGQAGVVGVISSANSLIGSLAEDRVGSYIHPLSSGHYVVESDNWSNTSAFPEVGAVTWGNGYNGSAGIVSSGNSLVGTEEFQGIHLNVRKIGFSNFVVMQPRWNNGDLADAGAVTLGSSNTHGEPFSANSVLGEASFGGKLLNAASLLSEGRLVVGRPAENKVTIFELLPLGPGFSSFPEPDRTLDFGTVIPGLAKSKSIIISETGEQQLKIVDYSITGVNAGSFTITRGQPPFSIENGASDVAIVLQCLDDSPGTKLATLRLNHNAPNSPAVYPLKCDVSGTASSVTDTLLSLPSQDGWLLESAENSNLGGFANSTQSFFLLGDDSKNRQYKSLLAFDTSRLPDNAVIISMQLRIKLAKVVGQNPFDSFGLLRVDVARGSFGGTTLKGSDFELPANQVNIASFGKKQSNGWYIANLSDISFAYVDLLGQTQYRLYFHVDDNNNAVADYLSFASGNAANNQPQLLITYLVP